MKARIFSLLFSSLFPLDGETVSIYCVYENETSDGSKLT